MKHARVLLRAHAAAGAPGWGDERNAVGTTIEWQFTTEDARIKPRSLYPSFHAR